MNGEDFEDRYFILLILLSLLIFSSEYSTHVMSMPVSYIGYHQRQYLVSMEILILMCLPCK